ncbi:hypothetical protein [Ureibacillus sinduriensis]|uniref:DUF2269 family protein n=1 Tax=Ureibacillus sinduriensis BLB-1 = JCM 15800 TaxID=1384057 RepID=A0A0A3I072_9BACL|nr:hypothetical protein [Ureibacillus sinduriensis]KGR76043.1 hypothetical protein CD33_07620 [Ureibacillus sinduriensis BLB-1 = JCM 15800]
MFHTLFLYIHIVSAVGSIGPLFSLIPITKKMELADEEHLAGLIQSFQSAITVVKHAGHVLVFSGIVLIIISGWTWTTPWIMLTIAIMIGSIVFLARAFKPTLKTYGTHKFHKELFIKKLKKATWQYILILLVMLWLMVAKPVLWQ